MSGTCADAAAMATATEGCAAVANCEPAEPVNALGESAGHDHGRRLSTATGKLMNGRFSKRRLANPAPAAATRSAKPTPTMSPPLASARWFTACCSRSEATATADALA